MQAFPAHLGVHSPPPNSEVRDGVVVGLEDLRVAEHLIPKCVEAVKSDPDVSGRHPLLQDAKLGRGKEALQDAQHPSLLFLDTAFLESQWLGDQESLMNNKRDMLVPSAVERLS